MQPAKDVQNNIFHFSHLKYLTDDDFASLMNGWDTELTQLKLHTEKNCTKFKN